MGRSLLFSIFILGFALFTSLLISTTADAQVSTKSYSIANNTGMTISSLYFSRADSNKWGSSVLVSGNTIGNGTTYEYNWNNYPTATCFWDIKYITADGSEYFMENVNLCTESSITILYDNMIKNRENRDGNTTPNSE